MKRIIFTLFIACLAFSSSNAADTDDRLKPLQVSFDEFVGNSKVFIDIAALGVKNFPEKSVYNSAYGGSLSLSLPFYSGFIGFRPALDISTAYFNSNKYKTWSSTGLLLAYFDWGTNSLQQFLGAGVGYYYLRDKNKVNSMPSQLSDGEKGAGGALVVAFDVGASIALYESFDFLLSYRYLYSPQGVKLTSREKKISVLESQLHFGVRLKF